MKPSKRKRRTVTMKQNKKYTLLSALAAISLCIFIISAAVVFTLNFRALYYRDVDALDIPYESDYPREEIIENYDALIDYNTIFFKGRLVFPTLPMSESAEIHFAETKNIFIAFELAFFVSTPVAAVCTYALLKRKRCSFLKAAGISSLTLPALIGSCFAISWDDSFVIFHKLFFNNDYWIFDWHTDPIILMLPDEYFLHCALLILALIFVCSVACLIVYRTLKKKYN